MAGININVKLYTNKHSKAPVKTGAQKVFI